MFNKILKIIILCLISPAIFASLSRHGPYLGGQFGYLDPNNSHAAKGWHAARPFIGLRFNDNFAIEGGYDLLNYKKHSKIYGYDLMGKAIVPLAIGFSVFIDAGFAYIEQDISHYKDDKQPLPEAGLGVGFNLTKSIATDLSWIHMVGHSDIKSIDFYAVGVSLTF